MANKYIPRAFEKKYIDQWEKEKIYKTPQPTDKNPKKYILDMFPYPSGDGLHVGHIRLYIATDVLARYFRMKGYSVLHPMGWDAFGLPAESAAIKAKKNPMEIVPKNIANFKRQMKLLGLSYDWEREFSTTDPSYYKWTQWLFIQFFKRGLLVKKDTDVYYCNFCKTGLAEEEVLANGTHERCGNKITRKKLPQWVFRITTYADRLLEDLEGLDWPEGILQQQKNWIGKKEGMLIKHKVKDMDIKFETFTAYPAWSFADSFLVIAPEHPLVEKLIKGTKYEREVIAFAKQESQKTEQERLKEIDTKRGVFTGRYAEDPFRSGELIPIWVANFALMDFGTGIIRCSAHDKRDYEFAQKYKISLREIVERVDNKPVSAHTNKGLLKDSGPFSGKEVGTIVDQFIKWTEKQKIGKRTVSYHLRDWIFSRQRYWGEPIPMVYCQHCGWIPLKEKDLPLELPKVRSYQPSPTGESPLAQVKDWVNTTCPNCGKSAKRETDTMPNWAGSSWYFLRFADPHNDKEAWSKASVQKWLPVDWYLGGAEHAVLHLLYARFWVKILYDLKLLNFKEPFLRLTNVGMVLGPDHRKMSKSFVNVINPDDIVAEYGADSLRMHEMFMAPFSQEISWSTKNLQGPYRFLQRIWQIYHDSDKLTNTPENEDKNLVAKLQSTIIAIESDITNVKFNTSVSTMMEFINAWERPNVKLSKENTSAFLRVLAPFAPFVAEEIWQGALGHKDSIHLSDWPKALKQKVEKTEIKIPVQVNGKLRGLLVSSSEASQENVVKKVLEIESVKKYLEGKKYKVIYKPGKILNFVTK